MVVRFYCTRAIKFIRGWSFSRDRYIRLGFSHEIFLILIFPLCPSFCSPFFFEYFFFLLHFASLYLFFLPFRIWLSFPMFSFILSFLFAPFSWFFFIFFFENFSSLKLLYLSSFTYALPFYHFCFYFRLLLFRFFFISKNYFHFSFLFPY